MLHEKLFQHPPNHWTFLHYRSICLQFNFCSSVSCVAVIVCTSIIKTLFKASAIVDTIGLSAYAHAQYTLRTVLEDFAICDWWRNCKALCDVKFSQIEGKGRKFSHIEPSNGVISFKFLTVYTVNISPGKDVQTVAPTIRHIPWRLTVQHSTGIYP